MKNPEKIQKKSYWNKISVGIIVLAYILAWLITNNFMKLSNCGTWGLDCLVNGILVAAGVCVTGLFAALNALSRHETKPWLSWVGLVVNGLVVIAVFIVYLMTLN